MPPLLMVSQLAWVIASWSTTVFMITALLKTGTPYAGRFAICWALAIASIIEGFAFSLSAVDPQILDFTKRDDLGLKATFFLFQVTQAGFGWFKTLAMLRVTSTKPATESMWTICLTLGPFLGLVAAMCVLMNYDWSLNVAQGIFLLAFESFSIVYLIATIRMYAGLSGARDWCFPASAFAPPEKDFDPAGRKVLLLIGVIGLVVLHVLQLYLTLTKSATLTNFLTIKCFVSVPLLWSQAYAIFHLAKSKLFEPAYSKLDEKKLLDEKTVGRHHRFAFPEYWSGVTFVPILTAYLLCFILLRTVTMPGLLSPKHEKLTDQDMAVFRLYETYHPCILLDYLPGTLIAQPLFVFAALLSVLTYGLAWLRSGCLGKIGPLMFSSCVFCLSIVTGACFALVFTFSPDQTSVITHSVPYMGWELTGLLFVVSQVYYVWIDNDPHCSRNAKMGFTLYAAVYAAFDAYGLFFMMGKIAALARNPDLLEGNEIIEFHWLPFIAACSTHLNMWAYSVLSPMKYRPLAFELITSDEASTDTADMQPTASDPSKVEGNSFNFKFAPRSILAVVAVIMAAVAVLPKYINNLVFMPDEMIEGIEGVLVKDFTVEQHMKTLPGAAFVVVLWIVAIGLLFIHAHAVYLHEKYVNATPKAVTLVKVSHIILCVSSLMAHSMTIPVFDKQTPWFIGVPAFQFALALWVLVNLNLAIQCSERTPKHASNQICTRTLLLEKVVSIVLVVLLLISMTFNINTKTPVKEETYFNLGFDSKEPPWPVQYGWVLMLGVYAFVDCRKVTIQIANLHLSSKEETERALKDHTSIWPVLFFKWDVWKISPKK